jgi:hypothetical protein
LIDEKNWGSKISWHGPFKVPVISHVIVPLTIGGPSHHKPKLESFVDQKFSGDFYVECNVTAPAAGLHCGNSREVTKFYFANKRFTYESFDYEIVNILSMGSERNACIKPFRR